MNKRWLQGDPPTYQEFADFWTQETVRRKQEKPSPKDEWMFIRFMQKMAKEDPLASKAYLVEEWTKLQARKKQEGFQLLARVANILK